MKKRNSVSCIIPAYNEAERIEKVLRIVSRSRLINEVIVVDDGSSDGTKEVVRKFRNVILISYGKSRGKTFAVIRGERAARGNFLMLLDSDLSGFKEKNIRDLVTPVLRNEADVTIANLGTSFKIFTIFGVDFVSGQRVFRKDILAKEKISRLDSYGLEPFMNRKIMRERMRIKVVDWSNVSNPRKRDKAGFLRGTLEDISAIWHTFKTVGLFNTFNQMFFLSRLRIN